MRFSTLLLVLALAAPLASAEPTVNLVKDIVPGSHGSHPRYLTDVSGTLYFSAKDGSHGYELFRAAGPRQGPSW